MAASKTVAFVGMQGDIFIDIRPGICQKSRDKQKY